MTAALEETYEQCDWVSNTTNPNRVVILIHPNAPDESLIEAIHATVGSDNPSWWTVEPGFETPSGWDEWIIARKFA